MSRFKGLISYKAQINGIKVIKVDQSYTSQTNCLTSKKTLKSDLNIRQVQIEKNFIVDRDLNSTINIAKKYGALWSVHSFNKYSLLNVKEINSNELD